MQTRTRTTFTISSYGRITGEVQFCSRSRNDRPVRCFPLTLISPFEYIPPRPSAPFQRETSFSPCGSNLPCGPLIGQPGKSPRTPFPHLCSKLQSAPRDIFCIYNMNVCVSFISWVKYHSAPFPKIFWEVFDPSSPSPSSHESFLTFI